MKASNNLIRAILENAPKYEVVPNAPSTLEELRAALFQAAAMPVSGEHCENTIWPTAGLNHAFRALHDMIHWQYGHEFDLAGEYAAALDLDCYLKTRAPYLTAEDRRLLFLEVVAQAEYHTAHGVFPTKQDSFMRSAMNGLFTAIHIH